MTGTTYGDPVTTSEYWKPFFYLLEEGLDVMLVNAHDARNVPGRSTAKRRANDSAIAQP